MDKNDKLLQIAELFSLFPDSESEEPAPILPQNLPKSGAPIKPKLPSKKKSTQKKTNPKQKRKRKRKRNYGGFKVGVQATFEELFDTKNSKRAKDKVIATIPFNVQNAKEIDIDVSVPSRKRRKTIRKKKKPASRKRRKTMRKKKKPASRATSQKARTLKKREPKIPSAKKPKRASSKSKSNSRRKLARSTQKKMNDTKATTLKPNKAAKRLFKANTDAKHVKSITKKKRKKQTKKKKLTQFSSRSRVSKYHGVSWNDRTQSWLCRVRWKKGCKYVGYFFKELDAAREHDKIACKLYEDNLSAIKLNFEDSKHKKPTLPNSESKIGNKTEVSSESTSEAFSDPVKSHKKKTEHLQQREKATAIMSRRMKRMQSQKENDGSKPSSSRKKQLTMNLYQESAVPTSLSRYNFSSMCVLC